MVDRMAQLNAGIFEIAHEQPGRNEDRLNDYLQRLKNLAVNSGRPVTWGMFGNRQLPDYWRGFFDLLEDTDKTQAEVAHRPAKLFRFNYDKYDEEMSGGLHFEL